jgi:RNA polymerase sigma factor (sigma-70 family)
VGRLEEARGTGGGEVSDTLRVAVVSKLKHGDLKSVLMERGWSQSDLARFLDTSPTTIGHLINLRERPSSSWLTEDRIQKLFDLTKKLPEDLWPDWVSNDLLDRVPREVVRTGGVTPRQLQGIESAYLLEAPQESVVLTREMSEALNDVLTELTPRERVVLQMRFGLNGYDEQTLEQVGAILSIGSERVRQIEAKGVRKLRHPRRARRLRHFLAPKGDE